MKWLAILLLFPGQSLAAELPTKARPVDIAAVKTCATQTKGSRFEIFARCAKVQVRVCVDALGFSIDTSMHCHRAERLAWEVYLDEVYAAKMVRALAVGERTNRAAGAFTAAATLAASQQAWLDYRGAQCAFELADWSDEETAVISAEGCVLEETAMRAIDFPWRGNSF